MYLATTAKCLPGVIMFFGRNNPFASAGVAMPIAALVAFFVLFMFFSSHPVSKEDALNQLIELYADLPEEDQVTVCGCKLDLEHKEVDFCKYTANSDDLFDPIASGNLYADNYLMRVFGCKDDTCMENPTYSYAKTDTKNFFLIANSNKDLFNGKTIGFVPNPDYSLCGFKFSDIDGVFEPPGRLKREMAENALYLHKTYGIPVDAERVKLFTDWMKAQ